MQSSPYLLPLLITALLSMLIALVIWRRRRAPGATPLAVLACAVALWALTYMLSLAAVRLETQLFWANMAYVGILLAPLSWLAFALAYTGEGAWLTRRRLLLLTIVPAATFIVVWTNDLHQLFRSSVYQVNVGSLVILEAAFGPLFWVHTAYSYLLLLVGTVLLARKLFQMSPAYRRQAGGLFIGVCAPWVGNIVYLSGLSPFPHLDLTPFALGISGVALTWDLLRSGLFELVPIAHSAVFHSMEDGVIVLDDRARIVDINQAALTLMGRDSRVIIGEPAASVFASRPDIIERYSQVSEAHEELEVGTGENARSFDLRISPIADRSGRLNGRVIVLRDITERRRAAAELRRQNEELAALAAENARLYAAVQQELAERKQAEASLSLAKEAVEVASRAKSRFLGNMSHELRTPLTAILGYADLLEGAIKEHGHQDLLNDIERIQTAGRHLLELISDVLDITRIEAEQLELRLERFEIAPLIHELAGVVKPLVEKNGNTLQIDCPPDCGAMFADLTRVRQVLLNLLGNAAKFTERGQIVLRVMAEEGATAAPAGEDPALVIFQVSDTGIGMSPEQQQLLFKAFVQIDDAPTRKYGGSGLGLAISYQLCRLMGGSIYVTSEAGKGSTFTVELPRHVALPAPGERARR